MEAMNKTPWNGPHVFLIKTVIEWRDEFFKLETKEAVEEWRKQKQAEKVAREEVRCRLPVVLESAVNTNLIIDARLVPIQCRWLLRRVSEAPEATESPC